MQDAGNKGLPLATLKGFNKILFRCIDPQCAIQNPKGAVPMVGKWAPSPSRNRIPQPKLPVAQMGQTENQP
jgi:hypothetical protein